MSLQSQNILVVGGSSGIGLAVAHLALTEGAHIVIASRSPEKARTSLGKQIETVTLDMSQEQQVQTFFEHHDGIFHHILVSSITPETAALLEEKTADARQTFDTKYWGSYYIAKYGIPKMAEHGSLTFISGYVGFKAKKGAATMAAINLALLGLARTLALEVAPRRVNVVAPGIIDTPAWQKYSAQVREAWFSDLAKQLPVGKVGEPTDLAESVLFLMKNTYITGMTLHVDGGQLLM